MRKVIEVGTTVIMIVGFIFLGAGFNDTPNANDTLWKVIGGVLIVGSLATYAWFTRHDPFSSNPLALAAALLTVAGAAIVVIFDSTTLLVVGVLAALLGGALLYKADKDHKARLAGEPSAQMSR